jgi:hypothetical protein
MDAIRMEVREDLLVDDVTDPRIVEEFQKRAVHRYQALLKKGVSFIDDSSVDRSWKQPSSDQNYRLNGRNYDYFIISIDLSKAFIQKLHQANHSQSADKLDDYYDDHQKFLEQYSEDIGEHITDETFADRMDICERATKVFLVDRGYWYA